MNFPVEVRFTAADDIPLSTASGRESCYIAVHVFEGMEHRPYFEGVERIMNDLRRPPALGQAPLPDRSDAGRVATQQWERFVAVRDRVDPERRFTNAYLDRVLGA